MTLASSDSHLNIKNSIFLLLSSKNLIPPERPQGFSYTRTFFKPLFLSGIFQRRSSNSSHSSDDSVWLEVQERKQRLERVQLDLKMEQLRSQVTQKVARMEITNPEILRVTPAFRAFQNFGKALRPPVEDLYHHSHLATTR